MNIFLGIIDRDTCLIPTYVDIDVQIADGFINGTNKEWSQLLDMYSTTVGFAGVEEQNPFNRTFLSRVLLGCNLHSNSSLRVLFSVAFFATILHIFN